MAIKARRNFLPTLVLAALFWSGWGYILLRVPPAVAVSRIAFLLLLFGATFLTGALVLANSRRGFLLATLILLVLLFYYFQIANILNIILLVLIFMATEIYYRR